MNLQGWIAPGVTLLTFALCAWNAYQGLRTTNAILSLKVELIDRIAKVEAEVQVLKAMGAAAHRRPTVDFDVWNQGDAA